jgi:hypothetical protein
LTLRLIHQFNPRLCTALGREQATAKVVNHVNEQSEEKSQEVKGAFYIFLLLGD